MASPKRTDVVQKYKIACLFPFSGFFSVAFHATVNERYPTIGSGEKVKFDKLKLNTGNGSEPL